MGILYVAPEYVMGMVPERVSNMLSEPSFEMRWPVLGSKLRTCWTSSTTSPRTLCGSAYRDRSWFSTESTDAAIVGKGG